MFIYVFNFGVQGAAFATILSQVFGAIIPLVYFFRKKTSSLIHFEKPILDFKDIGKAAYNGSSEMASNVSMSLVNMLYNIQLCKYLEKVVLVHMEQSCMLGLFLLELSSDFQ